MMVYKNDVFEIYYISKLIFESGHASSPLKNADLRTRLVVILSLFSLSKQTALEVGDSRVL